MEMKGSRVANFKINSKGQLRHFNCTIPEHTGRRTEQGGGGGGGVGGRERRGKKEKRGDRRGRRSVVATEKVKEEKDRQRGGVEVGMDGQKK